MRPMSRTALATEPEVPGGVVATPAVALVQHPVDQRHGVARRSFSLEGDFAAPHGIVSRIDAELACLFGGDIVTRARQTDTVDLDLDAAFLDEIADTASELLRVEGQPKQQGRLVRGMAPDKRLVLCMWLIDTELAAKMVSR